MIESIGHPRRAASSIPTVLARIGNLELLARTVVDGFINGLHRAPYFGASVDFAEHRGYMPGDDIRRIDWRLYARTDRYYIKEYEADTNIELLGAARRVEVDGLRQPRRSPSSTTRSSRRLPGVPGARQRDRVGLVTFDDDIVDHVPPSAKHLDVVLHTLDRAEAGASPGNLLAPLHKLAEHFGRRGILVRDLGFLRGAGRDRRRARAAARPRQRHDRLPPARSGGDRLLVRRPSSFEDMETGEQMPVMPEELRDAVPASWSRRTSPR